MSDKITQANPERLREIVSHHGGDFGTFGRFTEKHVNEMQRCKVLS
jgi:hypothetical protein